MINLRLHFRCYSVLKHMQNLASVARKCKSVSTQIYVKQCYTGSNFHVPIQHEPGSKYHPGSLIERIEQNIEDMLSKSEGFSYDEWTNIKDDIIDNYDVISGANFDSVVMNCLLNLNNLDLAHSFMKYLEDANVNTNFLTHMKYMSLCSRHLDPYSHKIILKKLEKLKPLIDATPILDQRRAEYFIHGLCATVYWRDSLEYLQKIPQRPTMEIRNTIACAAIKNGDEALAWEILTKWMRFEEHPNNKVFNQFVLHAMKLLEVNHQKSNLFIEKLFKYIQEKEIKIGENVVNLLEEYFKKESSSWKITYSKLDRKGECDSCRRKVELMNVTEEDFVYLRLSFLQKSVKKTDIFINTTEREFNNFIKFIGGKIPYHLVIDGLNAAYTYPGVRSQRNLALQLLRVVTMLQKDNQKILILGRRQMRFWPKNIMEKISRCADIFITQSISQDDPYVIYATLASGPDALFISSDLMRDHIYRLDDPKLIHLFKKWQLSHQMFITVNDDNSIKLIEPLNHSINIQGSMDDGWHIPFDDKIMLDPYEHLNNWLCVQKSRS